MSYLEVRGILKRDPEFETELAVQGIASAIDAVEDFKPRELAPYLDSLIVAQQKIDYIVDLLRRRRSAG